MLIQTTVSRTEGSLEDPVMGQTCYRNRFEPLRWRIVGAHFSQPARECGIHRLRAASC
jgi:hypothetical protein